MGRFVDSDGDPINVNPSQELPDHVTEPVPGDNLTLHAALALAQARAAEMATYSQQLLAPYVRRIEEQAEEIGTLRERTTHLQAELERRDAELEQTRLQLSGRAEAIAPETPPEPATARLGVGHRRPG